MRILANILNHQRRLFSSDRGATAIEYALVASLISVAAIVSFENLGDTVENRYQAVEQKL